MTEGKDNRSRVEFCPWLRKLLHGMKHIAKPSPEQALQEEVNILRILNGGNEANNEGMV